MIKTYKKAAVVMAKLSLKEIQNYQNEAVLHHFCFHEGHYSFDEALIFFQDLLSWMWLAKKRKDNGKKSHLFGPLLVLDKLWHSFILHTQSYLLFCEHYFGDYFHHEVEPIGFEHHLTQEELSEYLGDCFDHLGEAWVRRYFNPE